MSSVLGCVTTGPGWFADVFDIKVVWETDLMAPAPKSELTDNDRIFGDGEDETGGAAEADGPESRMPVFVGDAFVRGVVTLVPRSRTALWHGAVTVAVECVVVRYRVSETCSILKVSTTAAEPATLSSEREYPFELAFSAADVPETFEGDSIGVRCLATVQVERPWWTFDVVRILPFATHDVRPELGKSWADAEEAQRARFSLLMEEADEREQGKRAAGAAAAASAAGAEAKEGDKDDEPTVFGLRLSDAEEVPWWVLVSDAGVVAALDFGTCVVDARQLLEGRVLVAAPSTAVVRLRVRVLRLESMGEASQETVLFDGDAFSALTERGQRAAKRAERARMRAVRGEGEDVDDEDITVEPEEDEDEDGDEGSDRAGGADAEGKTEPGAVVDASMAKTLRGAGRLWRADEAIVRECELDLSLDLGALDLLPTCAAEAEDAEAEPVEVGGAPAGGEAEGSDDEEAAAPSPRRTVQPTIDFSVRTVVQLWVYTASEEGAVTDLQVGWNSRELMVFRGDATVEGGALEGGGAEEEEWAADDADVDLHEAAADVGPAEIAPGAARPRLSVDVGETDAGQPGISTPVSGAGTTPHSVAVELTPVAASRGSSFGARPSRAPLEHPKKDIPGAGLSVGAAV